MKKLLLFILLSFSTLGLSVDRFDTPAEKNHEDLLQINKNLEEICFYIQQLGEQQKKVLDLSQKINNAIEKCEVEIWDTFPAN